LYSFKRCLLRLKLVITLLLFQEALHSQNDEAKNKDTIFLSKGSILFYNDTSLKILNDTIFVLPKNSKFKVKRDPSLVESEFYDSLKIKSSRFPLLKEIVNFLVSRNEDSLRQNYNPVKSELDYDILNNKKVRKINIIRLEPFGTSVFDTTYNSESWIEKTANKIHIATNEKVIRSNLIFSEGNKINSYIVAENERILRNQAYFFEVKFYSKLFDNDSVDITIVTRDLWSIGIKPDIGDRSGYMEIYDLNFMGFGNTLSTKIHYNKDSIQKWGFSGQYLLTNIRNSFIDGELYYYKLYSKENFGINVNRSFNLLTVCNAGGITIEKTNDTYRYNNELAKVTIHPLNYYTTQIWAGKAWKLNNKEMNKYSDKLIITSAYYRNFFLNRPYVTSDSNKLLHNSDLLMFSLSLSKRKYYKSNLIYAFGTIEDIPYGFKTEFTYGYEKREFFKRNYYGFQFATANFWGNLGYLYTNIGLGGYINYNSVEQSTFKAIVKTFSNLYYFRNYKFRNFLTFKYILGINRYDGEYIFLDENLGESLNNQTKGTQKLSFNMETVSFTPANFYGFKSVLFGFWDIGIIGSNKHFIFSEKYFLGVGLGMRIRNDNLVFQTFQFKIAYYPIIPGGSNGIFFSITGQDVLKLFDFITDKPREIEFK